MRADNLVRRYLIPHSPYRHVCEGLIGPMLIVCFCQSRIPPPPPPPSPQPRAVSSLVKGTAGARADLPSGVVKTDFNLAGGRTLK